MKVEITHNFIQSFGQFKISGHQEPADHPKALAEQQILMQHCLCHPIPHQMRQASAHPCRHQTSLPLAVHYNLLAPYEHKIYEQNTPAFIFTLTNPLASNPRNSFSPMDSQSYRTAMQAWRKIQPTSQQASSDSHLPLLDGASTN